MAGSGGRGFRRRDSTGCLWGGGSGLRRAESAVSLLSVGVLAALGVMNLHGGLFRELVRV